jgi:hypothetical protein
LKKFLSFRVSENRITIIESWEIPNRFFIAEIKHDLEGLKEGTILVSKKSGLRWKLQKRIVHSHTVNGQKKFEIETLQYVRSSFKSPEQMEESISKILEQEKNGIFNYTIIPMEHNSKPMPLDELTIET